VNPALDYAENVLGVHRVYDEANELNDELNKTLDLLDSAIDARRDMDEKIADYEMDLLIAERGKHPDHSEAAFARHLKEVHHKDAQLKMMRQVRNAKSGEVSGLELEIEYIKSQLKVKVARMEVLGGYFRFLAVTKEAELQNNSANSANSTGVTQ
jgi:hypothetical protein